MARPLKRHEETAQLFRKALNLCFLDGGLPQGTPVSPFLTNLSMLPIDHRIMNDLVKDGYVYTRYADDILISHQYDFDDKKMCRYINGVLQRFEAPFRLKDEKTRYGSSAGKNWNLGVMLNKDNEITIGRKKKLQLRATCNSFVRDTQNGDIWNPHDVQILNGQLSYYKMVEPTYIREFIQWFNQKYKVNLMRMLRDQLK
ncbi:MAG: reverse transcriptase domain-containing protein [bacterium]